MVSMPSRPLELMPVRPNFNSTARADFQPRRVVPFFRTSVIHVLTTSAGSWQSGAPVASCEFEEGKTWQTDSRTRAQTYWTVHDSCVRLVQKMASSRDFREATAYLT
jgi:hypothetical protein